MNKRRQECMSVNRFADAMCRVIQIGSEFVCSSAWLHAAATYLAIDRGREQLGVVSRVKVHRSHPVSVPAPHTSTCNLQTLL